MFRFLAMFSLLLSSSLSYACLFEFDDSESQERIVMGTGGDCYYKFTRQPQASDEQIWHTEFYSSPDDDVPLFTRPEEFDSSLLCLQDSDEGRIAFITRNYGLADSEELDDKAWLQVYVDNRIVESYAPIEFVLREENFLWYGSYGTCGPSYLKENNGFLLENSNYVYEVVTHDNRVFHLEPVTGEMLPVEQALDVQLMDALRYGAIEDVFALLFEGANPNHGNAIVGTPLNFAADQGRAEAVDLLLSFGALIDLKTEICKNKQGEERSDCLSYTYDPFTESRLTQVHQPLRAASLQGHLEVVKILLERGADINQKDFSYNLEGFHVGASAIEAATQEGHIDLFDYLLEQGADTSDMNLLAIAVEAQHVELANILVEEMFDRTVICYLCAIAYWNKNVTQAGILLADKLLEKGVDIDFGSPLNSAVYSRNEVFAKYLLSESANPNALDERGDSALTRAISIQNREMVELLLRFGVDVNISDSDGFTPLLIAVRRGDLSLTKLLLEEGADPNLHLKDSNQISPLSELLSGWTNFENKQKMLELLLSYGARPARDAT